MYVSTSLLRLCWVAADSLRLAGLNLISPFVLIISLALHFFTLFACNLSLSRIHDSSGYSTRFRLLRLDFHVEEINDELRLFFSSLLLDSMSDAADQVALIGAPYTLPCGLVSPNRLCKVNALPGFYPDRLRTAMGMASDTDRIARLRWRRC